MRFHSGTTAEDLDLTKLPKEAQADLARIWLAQAGKPEIRLEIRFKKNRIEAIFAVNRRSKYLVPHPPGV